MRVSYHWAVCTDSILLETVKVEEVVVVMVFEADGAPGQGREKKKGEKRLKINQARNTGSGRSGTCQQRSFG